MVNILLIIGFLYKNRAWRLKITLVMVLLKENNNLFVTWYRKTSCWSKYFFIRNIKYPHKFSANICRALASKCPMFDPAKDFRTVFLYFLHILDNFFCIFKFRNGLRVFPLPCFLSRFSPENMARNWDFNQDIIIYSWQLLTRTESESKESSVSNETPLKVLKYCDISRYLRAAKSA